MHKVLTRFTHTFQYLIISGNERSPIRNKTAHSQTQCMELTQTEYHSSYTIAIQSSQLMEYSQFETEHNAQRIET